MLLFTRYIHRNHCYLGEMDVIRRASKFFKIPVHVKVPRSIIRRQNIMELNFALQERRAQWGRGTIHVK